MNYDQQTIVWLPGTNHAWLCRTSDVANAFATLIMQLGFGCAAVPADAQILIPEGETEHEN